MDFTELIKLIPLSGGEITGGSLVIVVAWFAWKILQFMERKSEREREAKESQERQEREDKREGVHREATVKVIKDLQDAVAECEEDRKDLRKHVSTLLGDRDFLSNEIQDLKRTSAALTGRQDELENALQKALESASSGSPSSPNGAQQGHEAAAKASPAAKPATRTRTTRKAK